MRCTATLGFIGNSRILLEKKKRNCDINSSSIAVRSETIIGSNVYPVGTGTGTERTLENWNQYFSIQESESKPFK